MMIQYREFNSEMLEEIKEIYRQEGWNAYLNDDGALKRAFDQSLWLFGAFEGSRLVGFVRCVGDGEHILMVQDLIVERSHQKQGIGSRLFRTAWERYQNVRSFLVVTDMEDPVDNHFYQSFCMKPISANGMICYMR